MEDNNEVVLSLDEKISILKANGFKSRDHNLLVKELDCIGDRFLTLLYVYLDDINTVYINRDKISGFRTIPEYEVLNNHNDLHTGARNSYLKVMKDVPFLSSKQL